MPLNIVLVEPRIPQNTGNISRTCAATGARLHLVGPMGFRIDEAKLRRAFAAEYVGPDGTIKDEYKGQCNDLYMLKLGLCGGAAAVERIGQAPNPGHQRIAERARRCHRCADQGS